MRTAQEIQLFEVEYFYKDETGILREGIISVGDTEGEYDEYTIFAVDNARELAMLQHPDSNEDFVVTRILDVLDI